MLDLHLLQLQHRGRSGTGATEHPGDGADQEPGSKIGFQGHTICH